MSGFPSWEQVQKLRSSKGGIPHPKHAAPEIERRRPTLADRFVTRRFSDWERAVHPKTIEQMKKGVREARRFVLDDAAITRIGEIILTVPDLLVLQHQFARAPYDLTWIEFPAHILWRMFRDQHPEVYDAAGKWGDIESSDHTIGYLIDHERVNIICGGTVAEPDAQPNILPIQYRLHTEWGDGEQAEFQRRSGLDAQDIDKFMWGSTWTDLPAANRADLTNRNLAEFLPSNPLHKNHDRWQGNGEMVDAVLGSTGELRNIIAILLVMNRPSITRYLRTNEPSKGFHKGKLLNYMRHTTVTIDISAVEKVRLIGTPDGDAEPKRRGEVRGHYKHNRVAHATDCIHEYQPTHGWQQQWAPWPDAPIGLPGDPGVPRNWVCAQCGGKRWWRKESEKGDAGIGYVNHDAYTVTAT
jgi:hypothetical protein